MNALDQYIQLYCDNREAINAACPSAALNDARPRALATLKKIGSLPVRGDEGYEKFSVNDLFAPDMGVNINRVPFPVNIAASFRCDVPNISTLLAVIVNDEFRPTATLLNNLPEGVEVSSLATANLSGIPSALPADNAVCALNSLLLQDGVFIRVRRGVRLEKPIQIVNIFNAEIPMLAMRRIKIVIEDDASARVLVCDHTQRPDNDYVACQTVDITLGRNASLDYCEIEEASPRTGRCALVASRQAEGSSLGIVSAFLNGGKSRTDFITAFDGQHASARINGLAIVDNEQVVDRATRVTHSTPRCQSSQLFKYALFGNAQGAFEGTVVVDEGADFTDAHQTNRNLLVSPDARMFAMPQLEIYCDEVKCSHGATTGQLDANALFYMRQRGIPEAEARMMLTRAFMVDVIESIKLDALRDRMHHLVEKRLYGQDASCAGCEAANCKN